MKGFELVKREDHWDLYNEDGHKIASTLDGCNSKLSIKNCKAIANGYDLDKLAGEYANKELNVELTSKAGNFYGFSSSFKEGFQKALEILSDKKFSELDMRIAYDAGCNNIDADDNIDFQDTINSLQQNEFDVEILMGTQCRQIDCVDRAELVKSKIVKDGETPMLDKDSCLILKRI